MTDTVISMNNKILCWDEATETDLPAEKTIIFWWRQNVPAQLDLALQKKYQVVLCPRLPLYFDFVQDNAHLSGRRWNSMLFNTISDVYTFPDKFILPDKSGAAQVLGMQANLWTETVASEKRLDFMIFPRMAALGEAAWTVSAKKDENSFNERLKSNLLLYDKAGIYYYNPFDPSMHPEAIDFAPRIPKPAVKSKHHHHDKGASSGGHHKAASSHKKHNTKKTSK